MHHLVALTYRTVLLPDPGTGHALAFFISNPEIIPTVPEKTQSARDEAGSRDSRPWDIALRYLDSRQQSDSTKIYLSISVFGPGQPPLQLEPRVSSPKTPLPCKVGSHSGPAA